MKPLRRHQARGPGLPDLAAVALFAAIFAIRIVEDAPGAGVTFLYALPIIIVALHRGVRAALTAAATATALVIIWAELSDADLTVVGYFTRGATYLAIGAVTGMMGDRLRAATEASSRFFELSRDMLCTASYDGWFVELNDSWEQTLGWSREELMGRPFVELVHPDDRERTEAEAGAVAASGGHAAFTNRYATKDGHWRWIEWSSHADPERRLIYAVARDVTERRVAEERMTEAEERWRRSFEDSAVGLAVVGVRGEDEGRLLAVNEACCRLLGYPEEELLGVGTLAAFAHPDDAEALAEDMHRLVSGELDVLRKEVRILPGSGEACWVDLTTSLVRDKAGVPLYRLSQLQDVDARKRAELELASEREFQGSLLESLSSAVVACDDKGEVVLFNRVVRDLYEAADEHMGSGSWGRHFGLMRVDGTPLPDEEIPLVRAFFGEEVRGEELLVQPPGHEPLHMHANAQPIRAANGSNLGAVMVLDDVTDARRARDQLQYLADHDPLSGLFNRRRFEQELDEELSRSVARDSRGAVLLIDLDNFKGINDELGHAAGDRVISEVGAALTGRLRSSDVIGRLGGDEFGVLLRRVTPEEAESVAQGLVDELRQRLDALPAGRLPGVGSSIGVAAFAGEDAPTADDLLDAADSAMYRAKASGGGVSVSG
jgi:diguanylate cyclase (GGDEF)-like protein/PAS domain S-box-containing protein